MKRILVTFLSSLILTIGLTFFSVDRVTSQYTDRNINNLNSTTRQNSIETLNFDRASLNNRFDSQVNIISTNARSTDRNSEKLNNNIISQREVERSITAEQKYIDIPNTADGKKFKTIIDLARNNNLSQQPLGEIISTIGNQFIGATYRAGLLDRTAEETLFISLQEFDCVLFIETVLALSQNILQQDYSYQNFTTNIIDRRYRDGILNGYCSRLHYFSEWIADNQKRGNVTDITTNLGGIDLPKTIEYMSENWNKYPANIRTPENKNCILQMEANLAGMKIDYIPQKNIDRIYPQLQAGDIIGVVTSIEGLDFTHTGFVNIVDRDSPNRVGFLHASPAGKVTIAADLKTYIGKVKNAVGIVIVRAI
jgi:hypothetical protein